MHLLGTPVALQEARPGLILPAPPELFTGDVAFENIAAGLNEAIEFAQLPSDEQDQIIADQDLARRVGATGLTFPLSDTEREALRLRGKAEKDKAMLGDSGYERVVADFYPTPPENVDCLVEHVALHSHIWEPAAGKRDISDRLSEFGHTVVSSDLHDYGVSLDFTGDFLAAEKAPDGVRAIVTNPPYGDLAEAFIRHALKLMQPVRGQVAMFLRNEYDCGKARMELFGAPPFHKKIIVTKRPRWVAGSTGSPRHNYSWYVWDWRHKAGPAGVSYSHPDFAPSPATKH